MLEAGIHNLEFKDSYNYHLIGSLQPDMQRPPSFLQIYFLNDDDQIARRTSIVDGLLRPVLLDILESLKEHHKYAKETKSAYELAASKSLQDFSIIINETARPAIRLVTDGYELFSSTNS